MLGSSFLTGAGAGGLIGGLISGGGAGITKGAAVLGTGSAATSGSLSTLDGLNPKALGKSFTKPLKRMKHAIALHMPNNFAIRSGAQYEEADTFMAQAFMTGADTIMEGATNLVKGIAEGGTAKDSITNLVRTLGEGSAGVVQSAALQNLPGTEAVQAMAGVAPNPKKEQIFKNMDFRTFQYDYQFFPRSATESENIRNIINTFRYHMHPEFKDDAIIFGQKISHLFPNSNLTDTTKFLKKGDVFVLLPGENFGVDFLINKINLNCILKL